MSDNVKVLHTDHNGVQAIAYSQDVLGNPARGHFYAIRLNDECSVPVEFQNGPVKEVGINGLTNEALLAILIDRMGHLDKVLPCAENRIAIRNLRYANEALLTRHRNRVLRQVVDTNQA